MKQFISLLVLVVLIFSCQNQKFKIAKGTAYVVVYIGMDSTPRGHFLAKYSTKGVIDSTGQAVQDTSWSIRDDIDTGRDAKGKPLYDSVKKQWTKGLEHWVDITESSNPPKGFVQVCPIPKYNLHLFLEPIKSDSSVVAHKPK
jgi:hypothetical protein